MSQMNSTPNQLHERHWSDQYAGSIPISERVQPSSNYGMPTSVQSSHWSDFHTQANYSVPETSRNPTNYYRPSMVQQSHWTEQFPQANTVLPGNVITDDRKSYFNNRLGHSQVLLLGDSWVREFNDFKNIAIENGIQFDSQWWRNANVETIMQNLENYVKPYHKNLLIFCLISETWRYETIENIPDKVDSQYKVLVPNPEFDIFKFIEKFTELQSFCNHLNPNLKVFLMTPPRIDAYQFNLELISKYPPKYQEMFHTNLKYEASQLAEYSKAIYGKIIEMCNFKHGWPEKCIFRNQIIAQKVKSCQKLFTKFMKSKIHTCGKNGPFVDGLHPTTEFIRVFWDQIKSWLDLGVERNNEEGNYRQLGQNFTSFDRNNEAANSEHLGDMNEETCYEYDNAEDFNLDDVDSQPAPLITPDGPLDASKLNILMVGDYTVTGLNFGVQPGLPQMTVNYIPFGKLDQLISLADSYLNEKFDALVLVPFNWEFLNLTCLLPNEKDPKVPQINGNIMFQNIIQTVRNTTEKWLQLFPHLKVIWGLPYPIDFCKYYARIVTDYGSVWNPTPEINNAILYITKKFYSAIVQLEDSIKKMKPPVNYIDLRTCFFLKETLLECSFRQSDEPKFPPICLSENGIDPSDTLCQRFKYALVDKLSELDVKPSLVNKRRKNKIKKQMKREIRRQFEMGQEINVLKDNDPNTNFDMAQNRQVNYQQSPQEYVCSQEAYDVPNPNNPSNLTFQPQTGIAHPPITERIPLQQMNMQQSNLQQPINMDQTYAQNSRGMPIPDLPLQSSKNLHNSNIPSQPWNMNRPDMPPYPTSLQRPDMTPQSVNMPPQPGNFMRSEIPSQLRNFQSPNMSSPPIGVQAQDVRPLPGNFRTDLQQHQIAFQRSEKFQQQLGHQQMVMPKDMNTQQADVYPSRNMQQNNMHEHGMFTSLHVPQDMPYPAHLQHHDTSQQFQMQQRGMSHPLQKQPPVISQTSHMVQQDLLQSVHSREIHLSQPIHMHNQRDPHSMHMQQPQQLFNQTSSFSQLPENQAHSNSPGFQNSGLIPNVKPVNIAANENENRTFNKPNLIQQQPTTASGDLLISGSMLDTLKQALNYLQTSKSDENVQIKNVPVGPEVPALVEEAIEKEYSDNSPFRILDIKESSYSCKLSLFFQLSRWKDLFLKGNKTVAMDTLYSAVKAMIMLKPGRGVKIILITTSEAFIDEAEKSLSPIVDTSLIGVNNDIPFGTPIALIDTPTNIRLRLAQSRFRDASELGALIIFGDDLIYNAYSPASIELSHLVKQIYNKVPPESVNKVVISETGVEEYEEVASQILTSRFSTKREKKRAIPKDDGLSLFELLAEELEKEEAEEILKKEAAKQNEMETLKKKIAAEGNKQEQLMRKLRGISPISDHGSPPLSPISDSSLPELEDEAVFAKFLESLGPDVEKEYMEIGKKILIAHEKQYQNFIDVPVYHPDYKVKRDTFRDTYKRKYGINYKQGPFEVSWMKFWKSFMAEAKEEEWSKKMTKLQEKFRIKYGKSSSKRGSDFIDSPELTGVSPFSNRRSASSMVDVMLGKKGAHETLKEKPSPVTSRTVADMVDVMLGKKKITAPSNKDIVEVNIRDALKANKTVNDAVKIREYFSADKMGVDSEVTIIDLRDKPDTDQNKHNIYNVREKTTDVKAKDLDQFNKVTEIKEIENPNKIGNKNVKESAKKIVDDNNFTKRLVNEKSKNSGKTAKKCENKIVDAAGESGSKSLKAKMLEFEKKKYAEIAKDEDFESLIFDAKEPSSESSEAKKTPPILDMFQEDDKINQSEKPVPAPTSNKTSKLGEIQQQLNILKAEKKIPPIIPMKFIRENPSTKTVKLGESNSLLNPEIPGSLSSITDNNFAVSEEHLKADRTPQFKPAAFVEVSPKTVPDKEATTSAKSNTAESSASVVRAQFTRKSGGTVAELLKFSEKKPGFGEFFDTIETNDSIDEIMKAIGSGKHFKESASANQKASQSRERSRSPIRSKNEFKTDSQNELALYLKEKGKHSKIQDIKNSSSAQDHLALYLKERGKLSDHKENIGESQSSKEKLSLAGGKQDGSSNDSFSSKQTLELYLREKEKELHLKEKQSIDKGNQDKRSDLDSSAKATLDLYLKEKQSMNIGNQEKSRESSSKSTLDLYLKEKTSMDKGSISDSSSHATLDLYLKAKQAMDKGNQEKNSIFGSSPLSTLDLYLKEKKSSDKGNQEKSSDSSSNATLDLYLKEKQFSDKGNQEKSRNFGSSSTSTLDLYLKEKSLDKRTDSDLSSKATLDLYLKAKQSMDKGNQEKSRNIESSSTSTLDLYLKEKKSLDKGNQEKRADSNLSSKATLDLYLKEKHFADKDSQKECGKLGLSSNASLDLYLKEKRSLDKGSQDKSSDYGVGSKATLDLYLKEKQSIDKGHHLGSGSKATLDLYLKEKQSLGKGMLEGNSKGTLELYLKEKGKQSDVTSSHDHFDLYGKEKRSFSDSKDGGNSPKKLKVQSYQKEGFVKSDQDVVTLTNTLNLLDSICEVIGMMGHALKAIIGQAKDCLPDHSKAIKIFEDDDSVALVNFAIKKLNSLSGGSESHEYSKIIKLATSLLEQGKSPATTSIKAYSKPTEGARKFQVDVSSIAKATIGKDSLQTYQFIKTTYMYKGLPEPSTNECEEVFKAVSQLHFTMSFKS